MDRKKAENVAHDHLKKMNPDMWDGRGEKPNTFDTRIITYPLTDGMELDISFEKEENPETGNWEWTHYCELRDAGSGDCLTPLHGNRVDSMKCLADTISTVCTGCSLYGNQRCEMMCYIVIFKKACQVRYSSLSRMVYSGMQIDDGAAAYKMAQERGYQIRKWEMYGMKHFSELEEETRKEIKAFEKGIRN